MLDWLPPGVEFMGDVSSASWVVEHLAPWDQDGVRIGSFLPPGFETYARVLHAARKDGSDEPGQRWTTLGAGRGVPLTPDATFAEVTGIDTVDQHALDEFAPRDGELPLSACKSLNRTLRGFTQTPDVCWFCLWEGNGAFWSRAHSEPYEWGDASPEARAYWADARAQDNFLHRAPKVVTPDRAYFLLRGPLDKACAFQIATWYASPNLCWPDDRSWLFATEVDGYSTYVGGTREAINAILASDDLEAVEVSIETRMDVGPYRPRWR
jgi:hypothetical protein